MACKKARGKRAKTRHSHTKKGSMATVNKLLQQIPVGSTVDIKINPSVHSGIPFRRYQGLTGTVTRKQGSAYFVAVSKLNKEMSVLVGPAHLNISRGTPQAEITGSALQIPIKGKSVEGKVAA